MPFEEINDAEIYYEVQGDGFPILMIQGLMANLDWWDPRLVDGLSDDFKVVTFDNRGAGRSGLSEEEFSIELFADDVSGLLGALGISSAHILGISMGGMIAQELYLNHPDKVKELVLCSTYCGGHRSVMPSEDVLEVLQMDRGGMSEEEIIEGTIPLLFTQDFIEKNPDFIELAKERMLRNPISEESYERQYGAIMKFDTCNRLHQIDTETLILHGKEDVLIPPENGKILNSSIPSSKLVYFENSAHGLMEEMENVVTTILQFLTH